MIRKTQTLFKRFIRTENGSHCEVVVHDTWLLFGVPLYIRDSVISHNIP